MKKNAVTVRSDDEKRQDVFRLLRVVWRRWGPIALISGIVLAAAGAAITIFTFKPVYEAKLYFRIMQKTEYLELVQGTGDKQDPRNVLSMIHSDIIASRVSTEPEIAKTEEVRTTTNPVKKLKSMVTVKSEGGGELYSIAAASNRPATAALVAQKFWNQFNLEQDQFRTRQSNLLRETLDGEIASDKALVNTLRGDLQETYSKMTNSDAAVSIGESGDVASAMLEELKLSSQANQEAINTAKRDIERHALNPVDTEYNPEDLAIELELVPQVIAADKSLQDMIMQLAEIGRRRGPSHPDYISFKPAVDGARTDAAKARADGLAMLVSRKRREGDKENELKAEQLQRQLEELEFNQKVIEEDIAEEQEKIRLYKSLRHEYDLKEKDYAITYEEWMKLRLKDRQIRQSQIAPFSVTRVFILDENEAVPVPVEPIEKYPLKMLALIVGSSLLLPFLLAGLWEFQIKRVATPEQISGQTQLIGEIADLPARFNIPGRRKHQTFVFQESVNGFSTFLRARAPDEKIRSLAVTSAVSHEGKTTFASQLAISLARTSSESILLIDCDLRKPSIHRIFDVELEPGVAAVLDEQVELPDAIVHSHLENLHLLPAGRMQDNPHRLLGQDRLVQLICQAETKYSYIIVDTPPVLSASESLIAARVADAAVICVMKDSSRIDLVNRAVDRLTGSNVNVMGFVFSGVPQREYSKRYGSYAYANVDHPRISNGEA